MNGLAEKEVLAEGKTRRRAGWLRDAALIALAMAIGWWAHAGRAVQAQNSDVLFQLQGMNQGTALTLYYPDQKTIYVYPNVAVGFSTLNCAFAFKLDAPGGAIERQQCKAPRFQP